MENFVDEKRIKTALENAKGATKEEALQTILKAEDLKGLSPEEAAILLQSKDSEVLAKLFSSARKIKEAIYGNRIVLFAPLYLTNKCINNCTYCNFRRDNHELKRKTITESELREETLLLIKQGHKRLLLVAGEHPSSASIEHLEKAIHTVYSSGKGEIRRVNINVAPLDVADFKRLKAQGIGTYQLFQETYHRETYKEVHPSGMKADFNWRLEVMDRAQRAGIDDVGIGALFGLYDFKFETLALLLHSEHLEKIFEVGPHTISVPRLKPAMGAPISANPPYPVSDEDLKKLIAVIRLAVPYTGIIMSTREPARLRDELFELGISQISAGSKTSPGAYSSGDLPSTEQFSISDHRSQAEVIRDLCANGFLPSFCTACYRKGRTGKAFMDFAKAGEIQNFCLPNAILTFKEYLLDYADAESRKLGEKMIGKHLEKIPDSRIRKSTEEKLLKLEKGLRDLYF